MGGQSGKLVINARKQVEEEEKDGMENNMETGEFAEEPKVQRDTSEVVTAADADVNSADIDNETEFEDNSKADKKQKTSKKKRSLIHWIQKKVSLRRSSQSCVANQSNADTEMASADAEVVADEMTAASEAVKVNGDSSEPQQQPIDSNGEDGSVDGMQNALNGTPQPLLNGEGHSESSIDDTTKVLPKAKETLEGVQSLNGHCSDFVDVAAKPLGEIAGEGAPVEVAE